jgi:hypothetical protein
LSNSPAAREALLAEGRQQLRTYRNVHLVLERAGHAEIHSLVLLWVGWALVHCEELASD